MLISILYLAPLFFFADTHLVSLIFSENTLAGYC